MNENIIREIEQLEGLEISQTEEKKELQTWLVFSICNKKYALKSSEVHEIIKDMRIYPLPFMPSYIEGVINRRGDPFTVINPMEIIGESEEERTQVPEKLLFLVLNREDDQLSLHISDILFFHETEADNIVKLPEDNNENYFRGFINCSNEDIPVLNPDAFEKRVKKDLGS